MIGSCLLSKPSGRVEALGEGVEVYSGHFQSLRLGWKPFLNVDASQRAFMMSGKVHHILADVLQMRRSGPDLRPNFFDRLGDRDFRFRIKRVWQKNCQSESKNVRNVFLHGIRYSNSVLF
jgi:hypothetical protein